MPRLCRSRRQPVLGNYESSDLDALEGSSQRLGAHSSSSGMIFEDDGRDDEDEETQESVGIVASCRQPSHEYGGDVTEEEVEEDEEDEEDEGEEEGMVGALTTTTQLNGAESQSTHRCDGPTVLAVSSCCLLPFGPRHLQLLLTTSPPDDPARPPPLLASRLLGLNRSSRRPQTMREAVPRPLSSTKRGDAREMPQSHGRLMRSALERLGERRWFRC